MPSCDFRDDVIAPAEQGCRDEQSQLKFCVTHDFRTDRNAERGAARLRHANRGTDTTERMGLSAGHGQQIITILRQGECESAEAVAYSFPSASRCAILKNLSTGGDERASDHHDSC